MTGHKKREDIDRDQTQKEIRHRKRSDIERDQKQTNIRDKHRSETDRERQIDRHREGINLIT